MIPQRRAKESPPTRTHPIIFLASSPTTQIRTSNPDPPAFSPLAPYTRANAAASTAPAETTPHTGRCTPAGTINPPTCRAARESDAKSRAVRTVTSSAGASRSISPFTSCGIRTAFERPSPLPSPVAAPPRTPAVSRMIAARRAGSSVLRMSIPHPNSNRVPTARRPRIPARNRTRPLPIPPSVPDVVPTQHDRAAFPRHDRATLLLTCSGPPTSISISPPS